jgi:hypothetical protein
VNHVFSKALAQYVFSSLLGIMIIFHARQKNI